MTHSGRRARPVISSTVGVVLLITLTGCTARFEAPDLSTATWASGSAIVELPGSPAAALAALPVRGADPMTGYDRDARFGPKWSDDVDVPSGHNGCDQRSDILRRNLSEITIKPNTRGCVPMSGTLHDPYTGRPIAFIRGAGTSDDVQIDHIVALADAWRTGAASLTDQQRRNLAGDPLNLIAVDGPTNQAKGDRDAAEWLPPNSDARCMYITRQISVKTKYQLWVTPTEKVAMAAVLDTCPDEQLPTEDSPDVAIPALNG